MARSPIEPRLTHPRKPSDVTCTDLFCGAGGSSIGASEVGARLRLGLNHWRLAIETHNSNFPEADHDCADVSQCDPRRYGPTTILLASPECTSHSLAKGRRTKARGQGDMFDPAKQDPADIRSRATMWDVCRFAEAHRYEIIIVENVVDVRSWDPFPAWLHAMETLGYLHRQVFLNSMFAHPTPQSRDRIYIVFWRKGNRAPDLDIRPAAWCTRCDRDVEAVQSWKAGRNSGRYRRQYVYCCAACAAEVSPYYFAALNAIDWTLSAERIEDRARPLKDRTIERIRYGLEKYGRRPLVVRTNMTSGVGCRVRAADGEPMDTQPGSNITALVHAGHIRPANDPLATQTTRQDFALVSDGAVINLRDWRKVEQLVGSLSDPTPTQVTTPQTALIGRSPFLVSYYANDIASGITDPVGTLTSRDRHALVEVDDELRVEDCYFRMLQPHEIGAAMAFPSDYTVLGNKRDRVKQYGNAVTPPAMRVLVERCIASLEAA